MRRLSIAAPTDNAALGLFDLARPQRRRLYHIPSRASHLRVLTSAALTTATLTFTESLLRVRHGNVVAFRGEAHRLRYHSPLILALDIYGTLNSSS